MTQFSTVLRGAIAASDMTQDELVARMGKGSQGSLSRLLKGASLPRKDMLNEICQQFPPHVRGPLVAAYFADLTPDSAEDLITVGIVKEDSIPPSQYRLNRALPDSLLRKNLDALERHALRDVNLANVLDQLAAMLEARSTSRDDGSGATATSIREDPAFIAAKQELAAHQGKKPQKLKKPAPES